MPMRMKLLMGTLMGRAGIIEGSPRGASNVACDWLSGVKPCADFSSDWIFPLKLNRAC